MNVPGTRRLSQRAPGCRNQDGGNQTFKSREEGASMGDEKFWAASTRIVPQKVGEVDGAEGAESV